MAESSATSGTEFLIRENSTAIDGLRIFQTYKALFLHLCFLAARDHPEISKEITHMAHNAQVQHSRALDIMEKFSAKSKYVVGTLMPIIVEGIDTEMPELIAGAFDAIRTIAGQMHSEAEVISERHDEIQVMRAMEDIDTAYVQLRKYVDKLREDKRAKEREISETDRVIHRMDQEVMRVLEYKKSQLDAVHEIEKLSLEEDNAADVNGLINAKEGLGQVYDQLVRLNEFWGQIVVCIHLINNDTKAAYMYRTSSNHLRMKVQQSELNWKTFIAICDKYVSVCKHDDSESVGKLYRFLSEPKDSLTKAERRKLQADIAEQLKRRIAELGDE